MRKSLVLVLARLKVSVSNAPRQSEIKERGCVADQPRSVPRRPTDGFVRTLVLALAILTGQSAESKVFNIRDFGATGDGVTLDSAAVQKTIDACHAAGGGTVLVPAGSFVVGTIQLKSNIRLHLETNARLLGSTNLDHYVQRPRGEFVCMTSSSWVMLHATNVENVVIEGKGTVDGANAGFTNAVTGQWQRGPLGILFERSRNISLWDFTITKTPGWAVTFFECEHVDLRRLQILKVMADGINPVCSRHVLYDSINFDGTGDDPITTVHRRGADQRYRHLELRCQKHQTWGPGDSLRWRRFIFSLLV